MNTMNMPGFTAEASIYRKGQFYFAIAGFSQTEGAVWPQTSYSDCSYCGDPSDCFDLPHGSDIRRCEAAIRRCWHSCLSHH
jgi:hypothetical protein